MDDHLYLHQRQVVPSTRLAPAPPLADALSAAGFSRLLDPPSGVPHAAGALFASADLRALLTLESAPDGPPALHLRTMLENGAVVETSERVSESAPLFAHHPLLEAALPARLAERSLPGARYTLRLAPPGELTALWALHQERVARAERRFGSGVPPHDSALVGRCIDARLRQIRSLHERRVGGFGQSVGIVAVASAVLVLIIALAVTMRWSDPASSAPGAVPGLVLMLAGLALPAAGLLLLAAFNTLVAPRLPGPRPRPLAELLREQGDQISR